MEERHLVLIRFTESQPKKSEERELRKKKKSNNKKNTIRKTPTVFRTPRYGKRRHYLRVALWLHWLRSEGKKRKEAERPKERRISQLFSSERGLKRKRYSRRTGDQTQWNVGRKQRVCASKKRSRIWRGNNKNIFFSFLYT
jgi:hypothetical protein